MDKDQEILAVSRLIFELTKMGSIDSDLDRLQARLFDLLSSLQGVQVLPQSVILLNNPRGRLVQVAQFGLQPAYGRQSQSNDDFVSGSTTHVAYVTTLALHSPPLSIDGAESDSPCFVLPLMDEGLPIGRLLLFIDPAWQPDPVEIEFMTDLSQAISMLVSRCMVNETLRVREVELEDARADAIRRLGAASEYRDNETGMHVMRMTHYASAIAKALGLSEEMREVLTICAPMHDVGKIGISDAILLKPDRLTVEEYEVMKTHTDIGKKLLIGDDVLITAARDIAASHHERWDGKGYPEGLQGQNIPILARICAIADVFDALTSTRPYKRPWSFDDAINYVHKESGSYFDPDVVNAFDQALPEISRIRELYRDDIIDPNQVIQFPRIDSREDVWVAWDQSLSVGINVIDEHHRYLFDLTNDLFDVVKAKRGAREVARILKALDQYARVHFRAEERMMESHSYAALDQQLHQHEKFENKLKGFYDELHRNPLTTPFDVLIYLRDWLIQHIRVEDAKLSELVGVS
jgi:hemerythrin-like metal-binding protein